MVVYVDIKKIMENSFSITIIGFPENDVVLKALTLVCILTEQKPLSTNLRFIFHLQEKNANKTLE